ncbi:MAG: hypothetical protein H2050_07155 [Sphingobium sp.]|uniref:hypothetical protein n=1 Tax=Sphingobium sp. TaxID=1912891 RepID=UPI000C43E363|nr:hypothetical protein [Sphingobium sp.]MBA4754591.1 hypothetical protein [Sphingobium sp.]MBS87177.1 hypothetical protein [Sphingobium sp.]
MSLLTEALAPRSDQLNADDLIAGPRVITITSVRAVKDGRETKLVLNYEGDNGKPFKPCKTMGRAMVLAWAITPDNFEQEFPGKSIRVYRDPEVTFGADGKVGGIRISHMSHIDGPKTIKLTVSQGKKRDFTFHPLVREAQRKPDPNAAANWANEHIARLGQIDTPEALAAHIEAGAKSVAKLEATRPDLHTKVIEAYEIRRDMLTPLDGKPESETGEGFTDDADFPA